ncbi:MAG: ribosome maturation factor RimM [Eubacteriales bacterium]|jgi:16S rRNA processing protein RimM
MMTYLSIGLVLKPQGLKGELKVKPLTEDPKRFDRLDYVLIKDESKKDNVYIKHKIERSRHSKGFVYLKLEQIDSIEDAEILRNQYLWIPRELAIKLPEDTFFIGDIIGCTVVTIEGKSLGQVSNVIKTGSNDVYEIKSNGGQLLLPAIKKVVKEVDINAARIVVDLTDMKGLLDDED